MALAGRLDQWRPATAAQPHQPQQVALTPAATASGAAPTVTIPRVHLELARDLAAGRPPTTDEIDRPEADAVPAATDQDRASTALPQPVATAATPGPADHAPDAPASPTIPQRMVCHADARGPYGAADVLQECISRAPAYSSIEIPPGVYVLHRQIVV
jgi:hypothetical protein